MQARHLPARAVAVQQHHDIVRPRSRREKKLTVETREEFGFFSVLRAKDHDRIMLARFDPRY
jgi:hypothetical protein